jgi:hypothetical protein
VEIKRDGVELYIDDNANVDSLEDILNFIKGAKNESFGRKEIVSKLTDKIAEMK